MKKQAILAVLVMVLMLTLLPFGSYAEEGDGATEETSWRDWDFSLEREEEDTASRAPTSGTCGDGLTWKLEKGVLTVSGSGEMDPWSPWEESRDKIKTVVFTGGVTVVGESAFAECVNLSYVDFGDSMREIDTRAFYGCTSLEGIHLPVGFRRFGKDSFRDCDSLMVVYCDGGMPSFNEGCLWGAGTITVYHSPMYEWPENYVQQLVNNFGGRLRVEACSVDVMEDFEPKKEAIPTTEPTQAPTVAPTVPAPAAEVPAETAAGNSMSEDWDYLPDEPIRVTAAPETEPEPEPEVTVREPAHTVAIPEPESEEPPRQVGGDGWIGMVIVAGVLTLLLLGGLCFRAATHRKGRFE